MRHNENYVRKDIEGIPYILPYGQKIADIRKGVALNETGVILWEGLESECSREELFEKFLGAIDFQGSEQERLEVQKDIYEFLDSLVAMDILEEDVKTVNEEHWRWVSIGGLVVELRGYEYTFSKEFDDFAVENMENADMVIRVHCFKESRHKNGRLILRNEELIIVDRDEDYLVMFPKSACMLEAAIKKDGSEADYYCVPPCNDQLRYDMFHGIRLAYLYMAKMKGLYAVHSASLLYEGKAWLFSGPSGTGKSTHTGLWTKQFDTRMINGDLNLIGITDEGPVVYGMPWCGTSGIYDVNTYPLGGIVLLKKYPDNIVEELPVHEKVLKVMHRIISPAWTKEQMFDNVDFAKRLVEDIYVARLKCNISPEAAVIMKEYIDKLD